MSNSSTSPDESDAKIDNVTAGIFYLHQVDRWGCFPAVKTE